MKVYHCSGIVEPLKGDRHGYFDGLVETGADLTDPKTYEALREQLLEGSKKDMGETFTKDTQLFILSLTLVGEK